MAGFFLIAFTFEMLEVFTHSYLRTEYYEMVDGLLWGPLFHSFWVAQVGLLSVVPLFMFGWLCLTRVRDSWYKAGATLISLLLLAQVMFMRWNVVVGGQLMSKSTRGYVAYHPEWFEKEGILVAVSIIILPLVLLFIMSWILPFWEEKEGELPVEAGLERLPGDNKAGGLGPNVEIMNLERGCSSRRIGAFSDSAGDKPDR